MWIKMFLVILMLRFTDSSLQTTPGPDQNYLSVRDQEVATLACRNGSDEAETCDTTTWLFSSFNTTARRVENVTISRSGRYRVTENCSLVIEQVTHQDVGLYSCRRPSGDSLVDLSVVFLVKDQIDGHEALGCSVWTEEECRRTIKWLFQGEDVDKTSPDVATSHGYCYASVAVLDAHSSRYKSLTCEVTHPDGNKQQFHIRPQASGKETITSKLATAENTTLVEDSSSDQHGEDTKPAATKARGTVHSGWWRIIIVSVGLTTLIITVVTVHMWSRTKGKKTQKDQNTVDGTVTYESVGVSSASVRIH